MGLNRVIWIVLDSVGMGEMPDAASFGDVGVNTIAHVSEKLGGLKLPNMRKLGYGNIDGMKGVEPVEVPMGCYGRLAELSAGKDTTVGHWEMTGILSATPFPTYPNGFPQEIMDEFLEKTDEKGFLGNYPASGTEIIKELGEEHMRTGFPIIYTSADSVFQIAAHVDTIPLERLYELCRVARKILTGEHGVARVIARPFNGTPGNFVRTADRRDFSRKPAKDNLLGKMVSNGIPVYAVGKIEDIFAGCGISEAIHTKDNMDGMDVTMCLMEEKKNGLIFTNLVEFDSKWGHRNDYEGYGKGLEEFDVRLGELLPKLQDEDLLIITADHGCDPTTPGTDHTREYVPLLMYGKKLKSNINLGTGKTFANIGQTVAKIFGLEPLSIGESVLSDIL